MNKTFAGKFSICNSVIPKDLMQEYYGGLEDAEEG